MRVDHHAYRKATRVAGFGFLLQIAIALMLLVFGLVSGDTLFRFASFYAFGGGFVWLSLVVIFYQHTQERLESLEADELAASRGDAESMFQSGAADRVESRRLGLMHSWLMPIVSILVAAYLAIGAWRMLDFLGRLDDASEAGRDFLLTQQRGWSVAICLAIAAVSFIFSRFVAGMARQPAWQNLRGGAAYMVGDALVMLAAAVAIIFRFFGNDDVVRWVAWTLPFYMFFLVAEIFVHLLLNFYRPRIPGEVPRPAFDSRILSLFAAPESIVRSINEAVNYQFGFDITSSWGYQLVLRSFGWLLAFGVLVIVGLNMMVVVEPHERAVKLAGGEIVGDVHPAGIMWKLPWPLQTADVLDVSRVRLLTLTPRRLEDPDVQVWSEKIEYARDPEPFLVGGVRVEDDTASIRRDTGGTGLVSDLYSLVDAEISLIWRIREDAVLDYLNFSSDERRRASEPTQRQAALKALALRTVTRHLSGLDIDEVLTRGRTRLLEDLRRQIQASFDDMRTGVEVLAVNLPLLRPSGGVATFFEDYAIARAQRQQSIEEAQEHVDTSLTRWIGDPARLDEILTLIGEWRLLRDSQGPDAPAVVGKRLQVEGILAETGGLLDNILRAAEADRWIRLMRARAEVFKNRGELEAYSAAPELYRQREVMQVLSEQMTGLRKYVLVGVNPETVRMDLQLEEPSELFNFSDALPGSQGDTP